ncbi:MAG TPA: hypothetical protein VK327_15615, partial [Candidatus Paceibacterota bacterium]|nr:hypothetical protein [Candidatus Paceibacterota bacterium]
MATSSDSWSVMTRQLTASLKAANAPPAATVTAAKAAAPAVQASASQTLTTSSGSAKTGDTVASPGLATGIPQAIQTELGLHTASFTKDLTFGTINLGDFLQLNGVTLHFNATLTTTSSGSTWSGAVTISATSATLFPGKSFTATISNQVLDTFTLGMAGTSVTLTHNPVDNSAVTVRVNNADVASSGYTVATASGSTSVTFPTSQAAGMVIEAGYQVQYGLTGSYTIGGSTYSLTATSMALNIGEALIAVARDVTFTYNSSGTETQQLVSIAGASVSSSQFLGFGSATLTNFKLRADGFSFDSFSLPLAGGTSVSIGNLLKATSATLTATSFDVSFGTTTTSASMSGSVAVTLAGLELFPVGGFIQMQTTSVTGSYAFGGFDGTTATGKLSLTVSGMTLNIGTALRVTADGDFTFSPSGTGEVTGTGAKVIASVGSVSISSPEFAQVGTVTVTGFKLLETGFSVDNVTLTSNAAGNLGSFLTFTGVTFTVKDFVFDYTQIFNYDPTNTDPSPIDGSVEVAVKGVVLFPNVSFLDLHLDDLTGSYSFGDASVLGATAELGIGIPNLDITIGEALTIHLGHVSITPGKAVILHLDEATVTSNLFSDLETATIHNFDLKKTGFTTEDITINVLSGKTASLGGFLEFGNVVVTVNGLTVDTTATSVLSGSISVAITDLTIFPGNPILTSNFGTVTVAYDFTSPGAKGQLTFTTDTFSLTIGDQLSITGSGLVITPDQDTIATLTDATLTLSSLNNVSATIHGLTIQKNGFAIASATATSGDVTLGGLFSLTSPTLTFTDVSYYMGGSFAGTVSFDAGASLDLGSALQTTASHISATYNFETKVFNASIDDFALSIPGFVSVTGTGVAVSYQPGTGTSKFLVGATGLNVLMGNGSGASAVGVQISNATLALAVFKTGGTITYALEASGAIALVGLPANTLSLSASNVKARINNAGVVDEVVQVDSNPADAAHLLYEANGQSLMVSGLTLTIGNFVTLTGDFGFETFTDSTTSLTDVVIAASNVKAVLGTTNTNLTISGASMGLLIRPGTTGNPTTYALIADGGTDTLNGVPGVSLTASGLKVKVNTTGIDPETLAGMPQNIVTPDGAVPFDFGRLGAGDVTSVQGSITLNIADFVSLQGDFAFQTFTDSNTGLNDIVIAAKHVHTVLGTATTNLTIDEAELGLAIIAGAGGNPSTYLLTVNGGTNTLNGVPGLALSASGLRVRVNTTGVDPTTLPIPLSLDTPGGAVTFDFSGLGSGLVKDVQGHITLTVAGFITLEGDFGFQSFTDSTTGLTNMAIGAMNVSAVLGTDAANLTIDGASLGVLVISGSGATPTRYALVANGGDDTLNGIPGLSVSASGLSVKINNLGADPSTLPGVPTEVLTSGGAVPLSFTGMGAGATKSVEGTITLDILGFVSLHGSFAFQTFTDLITTKTDIAIAATGVDASLTVGNVSLAINGASLGLLIIPGAAAGQSTYALVANGGTDSLTGIPGLSLSASGLSVRINTTGLDIAAHVGSTSIQTPGGSVSMDFSDLGSGSVMDVEGHITLDILGFVSLTGDFGFQKYTDTVTTQTRMLVGAKNVNAVLGTADTNLTITGAELGLLILPGVGATPGTYALVANGGTDTLNGVPELTLTATGLKVKINNTGIDPTTLSATAVHTTGGDVTLDFTGLGAGVVTHIEGTVTLGIADFVSISGSFVFTKQVDPGNANITKIVVGASGVEAFLGTADQSIGVRIQDAKLGLVIYKNTVANTSTYALTASTGIEAVGLPSEITLTGTAGLMVNTTGAGVSETITTPAGDVIVSFTDGTGGTADQRNIKTFSGGLSLTINAGTPFTLAGNFSFSKVVSGG